MSDAEIVHYTPLEASLVTSLADVVHVGDYGSLWVHETEKRIHLTMGDSDGDTERGCTSFQQIAKLVQEAVQPFWPGWLVVGETFDSKSTPPMPTLVIAGEYDPDASAGWKRVATIGREVTLVDELRAHTWQELIHAYAIASGGHTWLAHERYLPGGQPPEFAAAGQKMVEAAALLNEAIEILRPLARPDQGR